MKKLFIIVVILLFCSEAFAAWTLTPSVVSRAGHYLKWKVVCTSDGSALGATDILTAAEASLNAFGATGMTVTSGHIKGETLMLLKVSPGTGGVIPDTTIDITLSDDESDALWAGTAISKDAISWHRMDADIAAYIPVMGKLYLTINDIGTAGDQVTLYFITWVEDKP